MHENEISKQIVDAAMRVHTRLGPGLLESTYEACLVYELCKRGLSVACQVPLPIIYDAVRIPIGYRVDMIVADWLSSNSRQLTPCIQSVARNCCHIFA